MVKLSCCGIRNSKRNPKTVTGIRVFCLRIQFTYIIICSHVLKDIFILLGGHQQVSQLLFH